MRHQNTLRLMMAQRDKKLRLLMVQVQIRMAQRVLQHQTRCRSDPEKKIFL
eukprot:NODE_1345_length_1189_cov_63.878070_g1105_i0.p1 GENE.NODE_1345_length_1189_cov_63.878070_g1105_i0~~NODE_1345_length_1189_cov_63.878070_g1105_i0.p1  ORF type:complete len:51 (-),score=5.09 NODE_1345_length_1189_cov_63.878070_g1105_i0:686-838(-)